MCKDLGRRFNELFLACAIFFFFFLEGGGVGVGGLEIRSLASVPHLGQDQSTVAQRPETTADERSLTIVSKAVSLNQGLRVSMNDHGSVPNL